MRISNHMKISVAEFTERILNDTWALRGNAFINGSIIRTPIGLVNGHMVYQQFLRFRNQFCDLGLCTF